MIHAPQARHGIVLIGRMISSLIFVANLSSVHAMVPPSPAQVEYKPLLLLSLLARSWELSSLGGSVQYWLQHALLLNAS
jgi:hypothetical protein